MNWLKKEWTKLLLGALLTCLFGCLGLWWSGVYSVIVDAKNKTEELRKDINDRPKKTEVDSQFMSLLQYVNQQDNKINNDISDFKLENQEQHKSIVSSTDMKFDIIIEFMKFIKNEISNIDKGGEKDVVLNNMISKSLHNDTTYLIKIK